MTQSDYYRGSRVRKTVRPPAVPTGVAATDATDTVVNVLWSAAAHATGYKVYRSTVLGQAGTLLGTASGLTFTDSTATPGVTYYYGVIGNNSSGDSDLSTQDAGSALPLADKLPGAVVGVNATEGQVSINVTWSAALRATSYKIYRSTTQGVTGAVLAETDALVFLDTTAIPDQTYYYQVLGSNSYGDGALSVEESGSAASSSYGGSQSESRYDIVGTCVGYGRNATGGFGGTLRTVTNLNDSGAGSLREAAETAGPAWIIFSVSGTITLLTELKPSSNKTIDARGADITLARKGILFGRRGGTLGGLPMSNCIVLNVKLFDCVGNCMLLIAADCHDIWVDHCQMQQQVDESLYVGCNLNTDVPPYGMTVSWTKWVGQNRSNGSADKVCLISDAGLPQDTAITLTMHHNWYNRMYARHPLGRYAKVHSFNNFFDKPIIGVDGRTDLQYLSESDIYDFNVSGSNPMVKTWVGGYAPDDPRGALSVKVSNPQLKNGATVQQINTGSIFAPGYTYAPETADATLQAAIVAGAGATL
jgi:pectate lyase